MSNVKNFLNENYIGFYDEFDDYEIKDIENAMQDYANQEVEKALKEREELDKMYKDLEGSNLNKPFFVCKCTYPSCNGLSNCRNKNQ